MQTPFERVWTILGGPVRYFAKSQQIIYGGVCRTVLSLKRTATNLAPCDFYVTLNPSKGLGVKARATDITHWSRILIDIDPVAPGASPALAAGYTVGQLVQLVPAATSALTIIDSGRGWQLWLDVQPVEIKGSEHRQLIERAVSHLLHLLDHQKGGCRIDPSCSDLSRVARCPGTVNHKTGKVATILDRYSASPLTPVDPQSILSLVPAIDTIEPIQQVEHKSLTQLLPYLGQRASTFLIEGVGTPGRHSAAYASAASLRDLGLPIEHTRILVRKGATYCRPTLPRSEADRVVTNAYIKREDK